MIKQYHTKTPETGKEAFELRLWDGRIGRWLTTDPAGQYHSPYLGMNNNPISVVDPDGSYCVDADGKNIPCPDKFSEYKGPTEHTGIIDSGEKIGELNYDEKYGGQLDAVVFSTTKKYNQTETTEPCSSNDIPDISMLAGMAKNYYINDEGLVRGKSGNYYTFFGRNGFNQHTGSRALMRNNYIKGVGLGYLSKGMGIYQYKNIYNEFYPDDQRSTIGNDIAFGIDAGSNTITTFGKNPISFAWYLGYDVLGKRGLGKLKWYNKTFLPWGRKLIGTE